MRIIKPLRLGLLTRPYQYQRRHQVGVAVFALATMDRSPVLLPEADLWKLASEMLDEDEAVDLGIPKPCAEFLASGKAYSHDAASPGRCAVLVQVGDKEKSLLVTGQRAWIDGRTTEPQTVDGVPVNWRHAYGGSDFDENPVGLGASADAQGVRFAPQVEAFDDRMTHPRSACRPVSFGPVSPVRPRRFNLAGKYDPGYIENAFPGLPDTMDPHFFNAASPDQWFVGQPELPKGAPYRIGNMHPVHAVLEGELPRWRARAFVQRQDSDELEEVALRHTTVWFFPDRERMLLVFHGSVPVQHDDGSDLSLIMPALELADSPLPVSHYRRTLAQRLPRGEGAVHALRDGDLVPRPLIRDLIDPDDGALSMPLAVNQRQRAVHLKRDMADRVKEAGLDPSLYQLDTALPDARAGDLEQLPDDLRLMRRRARKARLQAMRQRREAEIQLQEAFKDAPAGSGVSAASLNQTVLGPQPGGPPNLDAGGAMSSLHAMAREAQARDPNGNSAAEIEKLMGEARSRMGELYRHAAHRQQAVEPAQHARSTRMRRRVQGLMQGSRDLSGLDLTGVDLSGMDLSGARCRGTWMESADLSETRLEDADLRDAVLTRAEMIGTDCAGADFSGANLGGVLAQEANFIGARFETTVLDGARFERCVLRQAILRDGAPAGAEFIDCDMDVARIEAMTFFEDSYLAGGTHAGAHLERVVWLDGVLEDADYTRATLVSCAWVQSQFDTAPSFEHASLTTCAAVQTDLPGAGFAHALLRECNLRGVDLEGADFSHARLLNSDLSQASLRDACLLRADARSSLFMGTDFDGADLRQADFIDAMMPKSDFRRADLSGANLFRADISQCLLDDSTRSAGAYVKQAKTLPSASGAQS